MGQVQMFPWLRKRWAHLAFNQNAGPTLGVPEGIHDFGNVHLYVGPVPTAQDNNGNTSIPKIQLVLETLIGGQQNVKPFGFGGVQQLSIGEAMPPTFSRRFDREVPQRVPKRGGRVMVKQNPHGQVLAGCRRRN